MAFALPTYYHAVPYIHFIPISMKQTKIMFRILYENLPHKHVLRHQMTEIGNLS